MHATIVASDGLKARAKPRADALVLALLAVGTALDYDPASETAADGLRWVTVRLDNGLRCWLPCADADGTPLIAPCAAEAAAPEPVIALSVAAYNRLCADALALRALTVATRSDEPTAH